MDGCGVQYHTAARLQASYLKHCSQAATLCMHVIWIWKVQRAHACLRVLGTETSYYQALACARILSIYPQVSIRKEMWKERDHTVHLDLPRGATRLRVHTATCFLAHSPPQALPSLPSSPPSRLRTDTETQSEQQASVYQFCHLYKSLEGGKHGGGYYLGRLRC